MKRWSLSRTLTILVLAASSLALHAQGVSHNSDPTTPSEILGPQLIAWSQVQRPQPLSQPTPSPSPVSQQHGQAQTPAAQTFTGTIMKDGDKYILKSAGTNVYELDDQERARQYEGKQVKVVGTLDASGNSLHVSSIELLS